MGVPNDRFKLDIALTARNRCAKLGVISDAREVERLMANLLPQALIV